MIISRTPLRISFFGGGTDYAQYFNQHEGAVLGTAIDKYCFVMLHDGKSWFTFDLPNKSGLGSSSAYTVGLLRACSELDQATIAKVATTWEVDKMGGNVGYQDQFLCALGGFRHLRFNQHGVRERILSPETVAPLQDYLMLFDTHQYRVASGVVEHQIAEMWQHEKILSQMAEMVDEGIKLLQEKDYLTFGKLLDASWQMKRQLSAYVTTRTIDSIYEKAKASGAIGGKLLGAGGGGFMLLFADPTNHEAIKTALSDLSYCPFKFEAEGTKVLYRD